jgi:hypothetical protein
MKKITIVLEIINDGIKIPDNIRPHYNEMIKFCKEKRGGYISLSLAPPRKPRSTGKGSQNHAINGWCQQISMETGNSFDDVKKYCKQVAVSMGYPILEDINGSAIVDFWGNTNGISEADASIEEASVLIKAIKQIADELSITLIDDLTK